MSASLYRSGLDLARSMSDVDHVRVPRLRNMSGTGHATMTIRERDRDTVPPSWVLDRIAEEKFWAGYKKIPTCGTCFVKHVGECY